MNPGGDVWLEAEHTVELQALEALEYGCDGAVGHLEGLEYLADGAELVEVLFLRLLHHYVNLRDRTDEEVLFLGILDKPDGLFSANCDREYGAREDCGVPKCQNRQDFRKFRLVNLHHSLSLEDWDDADFSAIRECDFFILFHILCQNVSNLPCFGPDANLVNLRATAKNCKYHFEKTKIQSIFAFPKMLRIKQ